MSCCGLQVNLANDHQYMPQIVSSAIVNAPPPEGVIKTLHVCSQAHKNIDKSTKVSKLSPESNKSTLNMTCCHPPCVWFRSTIPLFHNPSSALTHLIVVDRMHTGSMLTAAAIHSRVSVSVCDGYSQAVRGCEWCDPPCRCADSCLLFNQSGMSDRLDTEAQLCLSVDTGPFKESLVRL